MKVYRRALVCAAAFAVLAVADLPMAVRAGDAPQPAPAGAADSSRSAPASSGDSLPIRTTGSRDGLKARLDAILDTPPLDRGFVGAVVVSLRTGETWYERNADRRFVPASNTKLFTTAAALEYLDPGQRFETQVVLQGGTPSCPAPQAAPLPGVGKPGGDWTGDLILVGGGDPSLTDGDLDDLAHAVAAAGISRLDGGLIADATLFHGPGRGPGWGWDWEGDDYAGPASALMVDQDRVRVTVTPASAAGRAPVVRLAPKACGLSVDNRATTGLAKSEASLHIERRHASSVVDVEGSLPADGAPVSEEVAVDDPVELAARVFQSDLQRAGVDVRGRLALSPGPSPARGVPLTPGPSPARGVPLTPGPSPARGEGSVLARHVSAPVYALLREMDLPSDNQYAETFLRQIGLAWERRERHRRTVSHIQSIPPPSPLAGEGPGVRGTPLAGESSGVRGTPLVGEAPGVRDTSTHDTADLGLAAERAFLEGLGITDKDAHLVDGSGLSRLNQVTPRAVVRLLQAMDRRPDGPIFFGSLPLAGRTGTLRRRMSGTPAEANVRAKTGTLTAATALSGRLYTRSGEPLSFSLLMNQFPGEAAAARALQDRFCTVLSEQ